MAEKTTNISLGDRHREMAEEIGQKIGQTALAQQIKYAIITTHQALFKDYLEVKKTGTVRVARTPMQRARDSEAERKAKVAVKEEAKLDIARRLGAEVTTNEDGTKTATWFTYWGTSERSAGKAQQQLPLMALTEELVLNQFTGDKKEIAKYQEIPNIKTQ